jgi:hypothetical protein
MMSDTSSSTAVDRVREACSAGRAPGRVSVERALRELGLSARQAKRLVGAGYRAAFPSAAADDTDVGAAITELLQEAIDKLRAT